MSRSKLHPGVGILAVGALLVLSTAASAAEARKVTFSKDVAPILQSKCVSCHEPGSIAPMSLRTFEEARPWARSIKQRVSHAPDAAVAHRQERRRAEVQERHVAQRRADRDDRRVGRPRRAARQPGRHAGAASRSTTTLFWQGERDGYGAPDLVVKSPEYTMPAVSQDQWWRPMVDIAGLTEPRWVRMVEIRPSNIQGRKILHHSIAHVVMDPNDPDAESINRGIASGRPRPSGWRRPVRASSTRGRRSWNGPSARATTATRTAPAS